ncbi:probable disease resistance protein At1g61310 [Olea europaea var. sylvestris]|uniref:probable disease resistance protein At1g61310 n=1 Tax=Olea europaea var. sylvestris TaxID=158386 RepID=UPI000C1D7C14|nr:probable disease resistance protein At1g61310 [Olea europaea var. sylvestris]
MMVKMHFCKAITSLFQESIVICLVNLQSLDICECPLLEEVVSKDARVDEVTKTCKTLEFPKLKKIKLESLRRFKSFTSQSNSSVVHQALFNQVYFPKMEVLNIYNLDCIVKLLGKEMPITSLHKLTAISLYDCVELQSIEESDSIQLLENVVYLSVKRCNALEELFDVDGIKVTNDDAEINMFGRLRTLCLQSLPELEHITRMVPKGIRVFQNLTDLTVEDCNRLRYLFSPSIVNSLVALEYLSIENCEALQEIIGREKEEENTSETRNIVNKPPSNLHHLRQVVSMDAKQNEVIDILEFPKLNKLRLCDLSNFKSFRSESNNDGILQTLFNQVTLPNMKEVDISGLQYIVMLVNIEEMPVRHMRVKDCYNLRTISQLDSSKSLQNLEILEVEGCKALEVLFDFECLKVTKDHAESVFGRLRSLKLESLDKLVHIMGIVSKGIRVFENLTSIVVEKCGNLEYLFSTSMAYSLVSLYVLEVSDCKSIKTIIGKEEEKEGTSEIKTVEAMKTRIAFPNLNRLLLKNLSSIQMFCSENCELVFPLLKDLTIKNCPMMKELSPWPVSAPKLDTSDLLDKAGGLAEEDQVCNK